MFAQFVSSQMGVNSQLQELAKDNTRLKVLYMYVHVYTVHIVCMYNPVHVHAYYVCTCLP